MHNRIFIEEDKEFTLDEFSHLVARAIRSIAGADIGDEEVIYTQKDVYFAIVDVLGFINERTSGNFKFTQTSFQHYLIHYTSAEKEKVRKHRGLAISKAQSALQIKDASGKLPVWAENDDEIMSIIRDIEHKRENESQPKAAPTHLAENRLSLDDQIQKLAQNAVNTYEKDGVIPESVHANMAVLRKFYELLDTQETTDVE